MPTSSHTFLHMLASQFRRCYRLCGFVELHSVGIASRRFCCLSAKSGFVDRVLDSVVDDIVEDSL